MSSNYSNNKENFSSTAGGNGKGIGLPDNFKCRICNKVKPANNDHFSKKEMKTYTSRIAMGRDITPFSAKLRCRHCSGENVQELFCQFCHTTKSKDDFSYNQRTDPKVARCKACVNWQETNEPGTETLPGPSMALQPAPSAAPNNPAPGNTSSALVNSTTTDNDASSVWHTAHASNNTMGVATNTSAKPTITHASAVGPSRPAGFMMPTRTAYGVGHIGTESTPSNPYASRPSSTVSATTDLFAKFDPFGGRGARAGRANAARSEAVTDSSASSETATDTPRGDMRTTPANTSKAEAPMSYDAPVLSAVTSTPPRKDNAWTTVPPGNRRGGTTFTGYDNHGIAHVQTVAPSTTSASWATTAASKAASSVFEENVASGKYGKPRSTTPRRDTGGAWFKSNNPPKGETRNHGLENYVPADLAAHAPVKKSEQNGWESEDDM
ncbi:hypothetical protein O988_04291 [Pseudogymnoascus sp. VKM F-3808]|nr:hypothetical protein O988_04291 [Pseudogymnoascus sp. VKM F-3808]